MLFLLCDHSERGPNASNATNIQLLSDDTLKCRKFIQNTEKCLRGPSYWCKSRHKAEKCKATNYCATNVWTDSKTATVSIVKVSESAAADNALADQTLCEEGPLYWCTNMQTAQKCNALAYCKSNVWKSANSKNQPSSSPASGSNSQNTSVQATNDKCADGPRYWCTNKHTAEACNAIVFCGNIYWEKAESTSKTASQSPESSNTRPKTLPVNVTMNALVNSTSQSSQSNTQTQSNSSISIQETCNKGPKYWCTNVYTAENCKAVEYCKKVWFENTHKKNEASAKEKKKNCDKGPKYWCANEENAKECEALMFCKDNIWADSTSKEKSAEKNKSTKKDLKCEKGPKYWCLNETTAIECKAVDFCNGNAWIKDHTTTTTTPKPTISPAPTPTTAPLPPECGQGYEYWCSSGDNAIKCDKWIYCYTKGWIINKSLVTTGIPDDIRNEPYPCNLGPIYWCANITASVLCHRAEFCIVEIWPIVGLRTFN